MFRSNWQVYLSLRPRLQIEICKMNLIAQRSLLVVDFLETDACQIQISGLTGPVFKTDSALEYRTVWCKMIKCHEAAISLSDELWFCELHLTGGIKTPGSTRPGGILTDARQWPNTSFGHRSLPDGKHGGSLPLGLIQSFLLLDHGARLSLVLYMHPTMQDILSSLHIWIPNIVHIF